MDWDVQVIDRHIVVTFDEEFAEVGGVVFRPGEIMPERCCQQVAAHVIGDTPHKVVADWRRQRPGSRVSVSVRQLRFCCSTEQQAQKDAELVESLLSNHVRRVRAAVQS